MQPTTKASFTVCRNRNDGFLDLFVDSQEKNNWGSVCNAESTEIRNTQEIWDSGLTNNPASEKTFLSLQFSGSAEEQPGQKQNAPGRMSDEDFLRGLLIFERDCLRVIDERRGSLPDESREEAASLARILSTRSEF